MPGKKSESKQSFEQSLAELEGLVEKLESGEYGLEESLNHFELGVKLYKGCREQLSKAEKKLSILSENLKEEKLDIEE